MAKNPSSRATGRVGREAPATRLRNRLLNDHDSEPQEQRLKSRRRSTRRRSSIDDAEDDPPDLPTKIANWILDAAVILTALLSALTIIGLVIAVIAYVRADNRPAIAAVRDVNEGLKWTRDTFNRIRDQAKKDKRIVEEYVSDIASEVVNRAPELRDNVVKTAAHGLYYVLMPEVRPPSGRGLLYDDHLHRICEAYGHLLTLEGEKKVPTFYEYLGVPYEALAHSPRALEDGVWKAITEIESLQPWPINQYTSGSGLSSDQIKVMIGAILVDREASKVYEDFMKAVGTGLTQIRDPHRLKLLENWCGHGYLLPSPL
ncbi:hypothetical protein B0T19DRAFT_80413 [Cercophora scortea]|uniref:Uncharacterized protein n=1 Tax=Cercophora scortea TaxID=314031 RepID=A0AAE0J6V4_9PEZI|nr:hypothetical protein B0T19DRAFT_80413 [Cercophora scortea]